MDEKKTEQANVNQEIKNEEDLKKIAGGFPRPTWICCECDKRFSYAPPNNKCDSCGGAVFRI